MPVAGIWLLWQAEDDARVVQTKPRALVAKLALGHFSRPQGERWTLRPFGWCFCYVRSFLLLLASLLLLVRHLLLEVMHLFLVARRKNESESQNATPFAFGLPPWLASLQVVSELRGELTTRISVHTLLRTCCEYPEIALLGCQIEGCFLLHSFAKTEKEHVTLQKCII